MIAIGIDNRNGTDNSYQLDKPDIAAVEQAFADDEDYIGRLARKFLHDELLDRIDRLLITDGNTVLHFQAGEDFKVMERVGRVVVEDTGEVLTDDELIEELKNGAPLAL